MAYKVSILPHPTGGQVIKVIDRRTGRGYESWTRSEGRRDAARLVKDLKAKLKKEGGGE
jgi:hypothetical protein